MVKKTKRPSRVIINPGGIEVEPRMSKGKSQGWGRRQADNQAYPKFGMDKSSLPRGLTAVPGTRRTKRQPDDRQEFYDEYEHEENFEVGMGWTTSDMDEAEEIAHAIIGDGFNARISKVGNIYTVSVETVARTKVGDIERVARAGNSPEPNTSSWEEDRYAGTHGTEPEYLHGSMERVDLEALAPDRVPDTTYLYRIPFREVDTNRATQNLKVRATTRQNALGEANEILAQRYPGGKFVIRRKSVRRLNE